MPIEKGASDLAPERIISLAPNITEILFALDLGDRVVGVTTACDFPSAAKEKEKVGDFGRPNIEKVISLRPDLILATGLEEEDVIGQLNKLGLKALVVKQRGLNDLFEAMRMIGKMTGSEEKAEELILKLEERVAKVEERIKDIPMEKRPKVYVEISPDPIITIGKESFIYELVEKAGGRNIAFDLELAYAQFSPELVIKRDPDVIILGYMRGKAAGERVRRRLGWEEIEAVRSNRIYDDINSDIFLRPGPRLVDGLEEISRRLYPEIVAEKK